MSNIQDSYNYVNSLGNSTQYKHGKLEGDFLLGAAVAAGAHHYKNKQRQKMGMPAQPMNKWAGAGIGFGLGYVLWFLPFALYMVLTLIMPHIMAGVLTVALFVVAWRWFRKRRARKYAAYYAAKPVKIIRAEDYNAPLSDEWFEGMKHRG